MASYWVEPERQSKMTLNLIYRYRNVFQLGNGHFTLTSSGASKHHVSKIAGPRAQIHAAAWFSQMVLSIWRDSAPHDAYRSLLPQ
jgi:hypothetical protein